MPIIDSVRKLAEKVGADTNGRTIADQLNIINQKLDNTQPGSRDISDAVSKFADKEDGTAILVTKTITENDTYKAEDDGASGYSSVTVNVPSGSSVMEVNIETNDDTGTYTPDKTFNEVLTEISNGGVVKFLFYKTETPSTKRPSSGYFTMVDGSENSYFIITIDTLLNDSTVTSMAVKWDYDGTINGVLLSGTLTTM